MKRIACFPLEKDALPPHGETAGEEKKTGKKIKKKKKKKKMSPT
jgi:hypothetical protein